MAMPLFSIDVHHHQIHHQIHHQSLERLVMTVSAQVQALVDQVAKNTSLEQSADLALKALAVQIAELGTQIAALQLQIANGGALHPDDITALAKAQQDLASTLRISRRQTTRLRRR